jgi:uncharacterized protein (TIGR01777 family)
VRILLSGASGLIGKTLALFLSRQGHHVTRLVRSSENAHDTLYWNPETGEADASKFENFDAVIHLAGENIAQRWTEKKKQRIFASRCRDTWVLSHLLARLENPPKTFIGASAVGFYGNRKEEILTEKSERGSGFLADLCQKWEAATASLQNRGTRVIHTRFGAVISPQGGMLKLQLPIFRMALGGKLGTGKQYMSWIALDDAIQAIYYLLTEQSLSGAFNLVSPYPVTQKEFAKALGCAVHRPAVLTVPAFILRLVFGEMADEVLLSSTRAVPERLLRSGFMFRYPTLKDALKHFFQS